MKKRLILAVGLGIGYVLGSRAGREQYTALVTKARGAWNSPGMKRLFGAATGSVENHAPGVAEQLGANAKTFSAKAASTLRSRGRTGLAETVDRVGASAQEAVDDAGEAAANAAAQHSSNAAGDASASVSTGESRRRAPQHATGS